MRALPEREKKYFSALRAHSSYTVAVPLKCALRTANPGENTGAGECRE